MLVLALDRASLRLLPQLLAGALLGTSRRRGIRRLNGQTERASRAAPPRRCSIARTRCTSRAGSPSACERTAALRRNSLQGGPTTVEVPAEERRPCRSGLGVRGRIPTRAFISMATAGFRRRHPLTTCRRATRTADGHLQGHLGRTTRQRMAEAMAGGWALRGATPRPRLLRCRPRWRHMDVHDDQPTQTPTAPAAV